MNANHATETQEETVAPEVPEVLTDKVLRECYVRELEEMVGSSMWQRASEDRKYDLLFGLESGFWSLQKAITRGEIKIVSVTE